MARLFKEVALIVSTSHHELSTHQSHPFVSYAQNGEDVLLWRALREVERGCYIDVGAAEPEADSVTCAFYQRGWRGVNLEPAPQTFKRLSAARGGDINLNMAAGDRNGTTSFFLVDGGNGLSTAVPTQMDRLREQGWDGVEIEVTVRTLKSIVAEHITGPVHFLKIDVEGSERAVLAGADLRSFRPWIIVIEATAPNSQIPTHQDWEDLLLQAEYAFVWFDGLNRFYVPAEKSELAAALQVQPNVHDGFVRRAEADAQAQLVHVTASSSDAAARAAAAETALQAELAAERNRVHSMLAEADQLAADLAATALREQQAAASLGVAEGALAAELSRAHANGARADRLEAERDIWMQEVFESNRHAAHLTQSRQHLQEALDRTEAEKARFHNLVMAMYASTSWKFARPMRAAAKLLGRR